MVDRLLAKTLSVTCLIRGNGICSMAARMVEAAALLSGGSSGESAATLAGGYMALVQVKAHDRVSKMLPRPSALC